MRDSVHGDLLLDIPTTLAHVAFIHGNVTAEDLLARKAALIEKLSSPTDCPPRPEVAPRRTHRALGAVWDLREHLLAPPCVFTKSGSVLRNKLRPEKTYGSRSSSSGSHPVLTLHQKTCLPSHAAFGALGFPEPPKAVYAVVPPASPSKTALKKADSRKAKQGQPLQ
jgi:hypothetical protein